jgi:hypothetical protein
MYKAFLSADDVRRLEYLSQALILALAIMVSTDSTSDRISCNRMLKIDCNQKMTFQPPGDLLLPRNVQICVSAMFESNPTTVVR